MGLFDTQDCFEITKKFERAAAYSVTEESVFSMMTPILSNMRISTAGFIVQQEATLALSSPQSTQQNLSAGGSNAVGLESVDGNFSNLDKADEDDPGFFERIQGNFLPSGGQGTVPASNTTINSNILGGVFNSECIPCGFRLNTLGELEANIGIDVKNLFSEYLSNWKNWLTHMLAQIESLLNLFNNKDSYFDVCALLKFLNDFVCIPDLQRMLSAMMALMAKVSFDFGGILDLILQFLAPLLQPLLSGLVDMIARYLQMIIAPLECIIEAMMNLISKADYNVLFQNINELNKTSGDASFSTVLRLGSAGRRKGNVVGSVKVPFIDTEVDLHEGPDREHQASYNLLGPIGSRINAQNAREEERVRRASENLRRVEIAGTKVDGSDSTQVERHKQQKVAARAEYREAIAERGTSAVGRTRAELGKFKDQLSSMVLELVGFLREATEHISSIFQELFDELRKLMGEFIGGGGSFIELLTRKMALTQMISFLVSVIEALTAGQLNCENEEDIKIENLLPIPQGFTIFTDDEGNIRIQEDPDALSAAITSVVGSIGVSPPGPGSVTPQQLETGEFPTDSLARQKLKSLIEFTGDPTLDIEIARLTDQVTQPVNRTFKCTFLTTVADAEQVNKWIAELNQP